MASNTNPFGDSRPVERLPLIMKVKTLMRKVTIWFSSVTVSEPI